jgi:hypothetical protein
MSEPVYTEAPAGVAWELHEPRGEVALRLFALVGQSVEAAKLGEAVGRVGLAGEALRASRTPETEAELARAMGDYLLAARRWLFVPGGMDAAIECLIAAQARVTFEGEPSTAITRASVRQVFDRLDRMTALALGAGEVLARFGFFGVSPGSSAERHERPNAAPGSSSTGTTPTRTDGLV